MRKMRKNADRIPPPPWDAKGGGGRDLANGPLDGQTNWGSNPRRRRAPPMAHTTRPSMPLTLLGVNTVHTLTRQYLKKEGPHSLVRICHRCVAARGIRDPWAVQVGSGAHVRAGCVQPTTLSRPGRGFQIHKSQAFPGVLWVIHNVGIMQACSQCRVRRICAESAMRITVTKGYG